MSEPRRTRSKPEWNSTTYKHYTPAIDQYSHDSIKLPNIIIKPLVGQTKTLQPIEIINNYVKENLSFLLGINKRLLDCLQGSGDTIFLPKIQQNLLNLIDQLNKNLIIVEEHYTKSKSFVYYEPQRKNFEYFLHIISTIIDNFKKIEKQNTPPTKLYLDLYHANVFLNFRAKSLLRLNDSLQSPSMKRINARNKYSFLSDSLLMLHDQVSKEQSLNKPLDTKKIKKQLVGLKKLIHGIQQHTNCELLLYMVKYISKKISTPKSRSTDEIKYKK